MTKIVINADFGGFGISETGIAYINILRTQRKKPLYEKDIEEINRDDPELVQMVEDLGEEANDVYSKLKVVEIPDGVEWEISEYDGFETVEEEHRSWN